MPGTAEKIKGPEEIYQIKVTLVGTRPPIWRRLLVPATLSLAKLHDVLQAAMGWEDSHLHEFLIGRQRFGVPDPMDSFMGGPGCISEQKVRLCDVLGKAGAKARYTYDFGDSWEHGIAVEKVLPPEPGLTYPVCIAGKLKGPPEDCGGIWGFYELQEAIGDPRHERHEELLEWIGGSYDPGSFSTEQVNQRLHQLFRKSRRAASAGTP